MKLYAALESVLKKEPNFVTDDGKLKKWVVISKAQNYDPELIELLLDDEELKSRFFITVKSTSTSTIVPILVFNQSLFIQFLEQKNYLNDSYTAYKNKVGLTIDGKYLKQRNEVALVWPFKDCILEGGQSREEDKREEVFFNEILAQDEITQLLEPKVLTNAKRYNSLTPNGKTLDSFTRNEQGTITDNLIIKGNNLLALHSLKEEFAGKVKLIYIDPPYNTGSDTFKYNDSFNHSTWLTFMRNRLEVAKFLLREEGVIFISCDDNEYTYLKCICDEIFGLEGFENIFHFKVRHENRILRKDIRYQKVIEQALCYGMPDYNPNRIFNTDKNPEDNYQFDIKIKNGVKSIIEIIAGFEVEIFKKEDYELIKLETGSLKEYNIRGSLITQKGSASEFYELNLRNRRTQDGLGSLYKVLKMGEKGDGLGFRFIRQPFEKTGTNGFYYQGKPIGTQEDKGNPYPNYYDFEKEFNNAANEGGVKFKNGKKPELFLSKIFEIVDIQKGDIVLDYHLGSGSTAAAAHKLGIQYIGMEQLNYGDNDSVKRLQNVIGGDGTGISKAVNWQGGGEFVYLELKKYNQTFIEQIGSASSTNDLLKIWEEMKSKSFLNYNVDLQKQEKHINEFKELSLTEQQQHLVALLDKNQLYVNLSSLDDSDFACTEEEKKITEDFYQLK
ncbi:DNA methyltransferase [Flavobacterium xanthum]|uniref:site-specific DNA-methyltransferase (adenine-specific) n=1 Tax=Flavobacterium xanthum TaxID=69322 RepID=A0A1M7GK35_9FLAO|nr:site-specific DNA-methyltransferase [Flavobacterium xanthum]SHM16764.1 adenine-specific DNA-methyltransferase [Flavobacterium xanthum]